MHRIISTDKNTYVISVDELHILFEILLSFSQQKHDDVYNLAHRFYSMYFFHRKIGKKSNDYVKLDLNNKYLDYDEAKINYNEDLPLFELEDIY